MYNMNAPGELIYNIAQNISSGMRSEFAGALETESLFGSIGAGEGISIHIETKKR